MDGGRCTPPSCTQSSQSCCWIFVFSVNFEHKWKASFAIYISVAEMECYATKYVQIDKWNLLFSHERAQFCSTEIIVDFSFIRFGCRQRAVRWISFWYLISHELSCSAICEHLYVCVWCAAMLRPAQRANWWCHLKSISVMAHNDERGKIVRLGSRKINTFSA